jgi:2-hydroxy-3-keto-5-methylthiopentenyl-1-phosphate phosphatase
MGRSLSKLVWFDPKVFNAENTGYFEDLRDVVEIERFNDPNLTNEYITKNQDTTFFVISSGSKGKELMSLIHAKENVNKVFIFTSSIALHQEWVKKYSKIKCLSVNHSEILSKVRDTAKEY